MPLPSAPVEGVSTTTAAGAAAAAAGQKRQREEESGKSTFLQRTYNGILPNTWWKQMRKRRWMLKMMTTSALPQRTRECWNPTDMTKCPIYRNLSETEFTGQSS